MFKYIRDMTLHYLSTSNLINWIKLLWKNKFRISLRGLPKAIYITLCNILTLPLFLLELLLFDHRIQKAELHPEPVFILGHWRSGTTFLQNLMSRDPQFAWMNIVHIYASSYFLIGYPVLRLLAKLMMPKKRPMDSIELKLDFPQEEEYAMSNFSTRSTNHMMTFTHSCEKYMDYCLYEPLPEIEKRKWKRDYIYLLKKVAVQTGYKPFLLKSPPNTCRIAALLELFPKARFIHIYRNPVNVYASTRGMYHNLFSMCTLQRDVPEDEAKEFQLKIYEKFYERYFAEKDLIPEGQLVEMRYEDFIKDPLVQLESAYSALNLHGFAEAKPRFSEYIASQRKYKRNSHEFANGEKANVAKRLASFMRRWGYINN